MSHLNIRKSVQLTSSCAGDKNHSRLKIPAFLLRVVFSSLEDTAFTFKSSPEKYGEEFKALNFDQKQNIFWVAGLTRVKIKLMTLVGV